MENKNSHVPITRARRTEFNTRAEGDDRVLEGYFIVFDQPYYIDDFCEEVICHGALDGHTDMSDVRALVDHLPHLVLARANEDVHTLTMSPDDIGLFCTIKINAADGDAVNLHARTQRGDVDQASFGFDEDEVCYIDLPNGRVRREVRHISKLWEVSVCTFPAYEQTYVSARSRTTDDIIAAAKQAKKESIKRRFKHHA